MQISYPLYGYYASTALGYILKCHKSCATCSSGDDNACLNCKPGYALANTNAFNTNDAANSASQNGDYCVEDVKHGCLENC